MKVFRPTRGRAVMLVADASLTICHDPPLASAAPLSQPVIMEQP